MNQREIPDWDDDERKVCRREWEDRVVAAIDQNVEDHLGPDKDDAEYEAGLHLVRQLRSTLEALQELIFASKGLVAEAYIRDAQAVIAKAEGKTP